MREILFRGKRADNGEWVEGAYLHLNTGNDYICDGTVWIGTLQPCKNRVIPRTVGQYTGLTDKNGNKIFEGDVVRNDFYGIKKTVEWCNGFYYPFVASPEFTAWDNDECEVIGNIYDNPELLEVQYEQG
jgi:uncharacterized phage protein (TIGR01671 family)